MTKLQRSALLYVGTGFACAGGSLLLVRQLHSENRVPSFAPLTAVIVTSHEDGSGRTVSRDTSVRALRSDGSSVDLLISIDGQPHGNKTIFDVPHNRRVTIDPATASQTTYPMDSPEVKRALAISGCPPGLEGPRSTMLGYQVVKMTGTSPSVSRPMEQFDKLLAPDLNCFPLREEVSLLNQSQVTARNISTVIQLTRGDPDPALFQIPAGLTERTPSAVLAAQAQLRGRECSDCRKKSVLTLDRVYQKYNRPR